MWLMKNSVKIVKLFLFMPPRKVHCFTETMGKEEGKKKGIGLPNIHVAEVKEAPPRLTFLWCWGGAGNSPVQYKFQSMHPGGCNCVNSLFPVLNIHVE